MEKPKMNDIKVKKPVVAKPAPVISTQIPKKETEAKSINTEIKQKSEFKTTEVDKINDADYFIKKTKKRKFGIIFFTILIIICLISYLIFIISNVFVTITPNIKERTINKDITLTSWVNPIESTVIFVNEEMDKEAAINVSNPEENNKFLNQKIISRFKYDTPKGYIIIDGCKTSVKYEENIIEESGIKKTKVKGSQAALAVKQSSLIKFINSELNIKDEEIKDITKIKCVLNSNITDYQIGSKVNSLSFNINGGIKTEYLINTELIKLMLAGYSKNKAMFNLNKEPTILNYNIKIRPFNFLPILPKNKNHYNVKIQSIL